MSSKEMSNSMNELSLSLLKNLLKYSHQLFFISSSLIRNRSVTSLMHFTLMSLVFLSTFNHPIDMLLSLLHTKSMIYSIIHMTPYFTHHLLYDLLCYFIPLYVIRTTIQVHTDKTLFLLLNSILHLLIPPCIFSFTFASFNHSEFF
jgi:hypothetical protein